MDISRTELDEAQLSLDYPDLNSTNRAGKPECPPLLCHFGMWVKPRSNEVISDQGFVYKCDTLLLKNRTEIKVSLAYRIGLPESTGTPSTLKTAEKISCIRQSIDLFSAPEIVAGIYINPDTDQFWSYWDLANYGPQGLSKKIDQEHGLKVG